MSYWPIGPPIGYTAIHDCCRNDGDKFRKLVKYRGFSVLLTNRRAFHTDPTPTVWAATIWHRYITWPAHFPHRQ